MSFVGILFGWHLKVVKVKKKIPIDLSNVQPEVRAKIQERNGKETTVITHGFKTFFVNRYKFHPQIRCSPVTCRACYFIFMGRL